MQLKEAADGYKYMMWDGVVPEECNAEPGSILRLTASLDWEEAHDLYIMTLTQVVLSHASQRNLSFLYISHFRSCIRFVDLFNSIYLTELLNAIY